MGLFENIYVYRPGDKIREDARYVIEYGPKEYRVANYGHVGFVAGEAGSMKSTFVKTICAAALSRRKVLFNKVDIGDKKIMYFDTEMPKDLFVDHIDNMFAIANVAPVEVAERFLGISLVGEPEPTKKREMVLKAIRSKGEEIGIVVIDVIADLFDDENDTEKTQQFIGELASLASDYNSIYLIVSHINDSKKLLGSIGRKLHRKSSFGMNLQKVTPTTSFVESGKTRYESYPPFEFTLNKSGIPEPGDYIPFPLMHN